MTLEEKKIKTVKKSMQLPTESAAKDELRHSKIDAKRKSAFSSKTERPNYRLRLL
jgi:hypothetical protein